MNYIKAKQDPALHGARIGAGLEQGDAEFLFDDTQIRRQYVESESFKKLVIELVRSCLAA